MFTWNLWKVSEKHDLAVGTFLSGSAFTLSSKERQELCLRAKSVIHTIKVKLGASCHHLMSEDELMLLL